MTQSEELFARAQKLIPGGVNSPVRAFKAVGGTPLFIRKAEGAAIWDADGNAYIDYVGSWGPMILGHAHPPIVEAIQRGRRSAARPSARPAPAEVELAERVMRLVPVDREGALRLLGHRGHDERAAPGARLHRAGARSSSSRAATTATPTACWWRRARASRRSGIPGSPGVPEGTVGRHARRALQRPRARSSASSRAHGDGLAAVIVEPVAGNMGCVAPRAGLPRRRCASSRSAPARC